MKKKKWPFVYVALITVLTYIPILLTVVYSFNASKLTSVWEGFSLKWYRELFRDRDLGEALINSLILAVLSCAFAVLIGTSGALGMSRRKRKLDDAVAYVSTLPIMIPEIILGMVFLSVFSLMGLPFGMVTLVIAHTTFCVPYVFTMVRARLVGMNRSLEEAALDLGATKWQGFWGVVLPKNLPAILRIQITAFSPYNTGRCLRVHRHWGQEYLASLMLSHKRQSFLFIIVWVLRNFFKHASLTWPHCII